MRHPPSQCTLIISWYPLLILFSFETESVGHCPLPAGRGGEEQEVPYYRGKGPQASAAQGSAGDVRTRLYLFASNCTHIEEYG